MDILDNPNPERKLTCVETYEYMEHGDPVVTTMGVKDHFNVSHVTARKRLHELAAAGCIVKQPLNETMTAWYLPKQME